MNYVLPKPLTKGDTIGVIAPSGPIENKTPILNAKYFFESLGYNVVLAKHIFDKDRYLSSTEDNRLNDLHWAFSNSNIDTIICARGGYGALRLVDKIDYELIKNNPKNFCGYSDITILSAMFLKNSNLITYSSPMMKGDFGQNEQSKYTIDSFFNALTHQKQEFFAPKVHKSGEATGIMWGGNLASLVSLCGMDFIPEENFIFFAEDLNEPVYKIDKMLTQLIHISKFRKNIKGIAFGKFLDITQEVQLEYLFTQFANELNIPTISGLNISHDTNKITVPYGKKCTINNNQIVLS